MKTRKQVGAIAYRRAPDHGLQILLVTSRDTGRWVIPKGWPMKSRRPHQAAAREAFEEAGVEGRIEKKPAGSFVYLKGRRDGTVVPCRVKVFPMQVEHLRDSWPEANERQRAWFTPADAAEAVQESELAALLRDLNDNLRPAR